MPDNSGRVPPNPFAGTTLADIAAALWASPSPAAPGTANALSPLASLFAQPPQPNALAGALESVRRRSEWNDRFTHWEKPASVSETGTIERAQSLVSEAIASNNWLNGQGVVVAGQGSYFNNTNVRTEADIDLRVVHPALHIEYASNVIIEYARPALTYSDGPLTYGQIFNGLRANLVADFNRRFGSSNVRVGNKAIRIKGITGSRAEVDVVPAVRYHWVGWLADYASYATLEGVAILGLDGRWTVNFPDQHARNGVSKRQNTACRFKKVVRIFKRLRIDMTERGLLPVKVPSFLIESLVHAVEDRYFLVEADDRYARVRRVALRMQEFLANPAPAQTLTEVNGLNRLFGGDQAWTYRDAKIFADNAVAHLGNV